MVSVSVRQLISELPVLDLGPEVFLLGFQRAIKLDPEKSLSKMNHEVQISSDHTDILYMCVSIYICMCSTYLLRIFFSATKVHSEPLAAKYIVKGCLLGISI